MKPSFTLPHRALKKAALPLAAAAACALLSACGTVGDPFLYGGIGITPWAPPPGEPAPGPGAGSFRAPRIGPLGPGLTDRLAGSPPPPAFRAPAGLGGVDLGRLGGRAPSAPAFRAPPSLEGLDLGRLAGRAPAPPAPPPGFRAPAGLEGLDLSGLSGRIPATPEPSPEFRTPTDGAGADVSRLVEPRLTGRDFLRRF